MYLILHPCKSFFLFVGKSLLSYVASMVNLVCVFACEDLYLSGYICMCISICLAMRMFVQYDSFVCFTVVFVSVL